MANYQEARVNLTNTQFNKFKSTALNKTRRLFRLNKTEELKMRIC